MIDQATTDYVAVDLASTMTGIPARTLRSWIGTGKLAAVAGKRGKLVSVGDVHRLAAVAGRTAGNQNGHAGNGIASAGNGAGNHADTSGLADIGSIPTPRVTDGGRQQLALIRDEWLAPLVATIGDLERQVGRLEAERDQARAVVDALRAQLAATVPAAAPDQPAPATVQVSPRRWWRRLLVR